MKISAITVSCALIAVLLLPQPCRASPLFEMTLKRDSIRTPGKTYLTMKLTDEAKIEGNYEFRVSIYVADILTRKQTLPVTKGKPAIFELMFPNMRSRTDVRCFAELFLNGDFAEGRGKALTLWPPISAYSKEPLDETIWVFDISGRLQKIFEDLEVETVDATFAAARNFSIPDVVFIGEHLDPNSMRIITESIELVDRNPLIIFLSQKQLPEEANIGIPEEGNRSENVVCDTNSPLLQGLNKLDIMNMANDTMYIKIKKQKDENRLINSCVTEVIKDKKNIYSYLLTIKEEDKVTVYCQLRVTGSDDPRYSILLRNLLRFAEKVSDLQKK